MLKIFYVGGSGSSMGVLRAVLLDARFADIASTQEFSYSGPEFPKQLTGGSANTIIEVLSEDGPGACKPGFYRVEKTPQQFEETLKTLRG
ncbi:MAG: hypothetical protein PVS2B2_20100 [Candidatus Acidiferrum sp.]